MGRAVNRLRTEEVASENLLGPTIDFALQVNKRVNDQLKIGRVSEDHCAHVLIVSFQRGDSVSVRNELE